MPQDAAEIPEAALIAFPDTPASRLRRALRQLEVAINEQSEAVAAFRNQIGALGGAVAGLDARTQSFRSALAEAAQEADRARAASAELMATAALMEATARR
ncbi:hypothetical protein [Roseomonas sp. AR75]|jgi:DNA-binding sugar fermentation-stimulating protein|uniref:hypothetical protein n=1 Tax=Roseomonas sp. AR75 TaxID=2562311 RepID=UPI0010C0E41B|nr:hypothetical protein [Roseomonas sp. AR75]